MTNPAQTDEIVSAYNDVRDDKTETNWCVPPALGTLSAMEC